jgi:cysteine desulfuration protein SufE
MSLESIIGDFELLDDWEDRYRYLIELGRELQPLPDAARTDANKVRGCASQVWLDTHVERNGDGEPTLTFLGDSDAHIVRGLVYLILTFYSGRRARDILDADAIALFEKLGLTAHLTPQRANGARAMVERIRSEARAALAQPASSAEIAGR